MYFGASSDLESVNKIITIFLYIKQGMFLDLTRKGWGFLADLVRSPDHRQMTCAQISTLLSLALRL